MSYLIKQNKEDLQVVLDSVHSDLLAANLDSYSQDTTAFQIPRKHPINDLWCASFPIGKHDSWDRYIMRHVNENDLVELDSSWEIEI